MQSTDRFASCAAVLQKNSMPEERSNWYHENKNISGSFRPTDKRISCVYISTTTVTTREEYKYPWICLFTKKILKTQKYTNSLYEEKKKKKGEWKNFYDNNLTMYITLSFVPFLYFSLLRFVNNESYPFLWLLLKKNFFKVLLHRITNLQISSLKKLPTSGSLDISVSIQLTFIKILNCNVLFSLISSWIPSQQLF